ncbi:MAG: hypothetical protein NVSMB21_21400 [Vulcanimicrobiaceae bacterium]
MPVSAIAFTMYPVTDLARAKAFYHEALGLAPSGVATESWLEFDVAGGTFGIGNFPQVGIAGTAQSLALERHRGRRTARTRSVFDCGRARSRR